MSNKFSRCERKEYSAAFEGILRIPVVHVMNWADVLSLEMDDSHRFPLPVLGRWRRQKSRNVSVSIAWSEF